MDGVRLFFQNPDVKLVSELLVVMTTWCGNIVNIKKEEEVFNENLDLIYDDYLKEDDVVKKVEFINKLPSIE